MAEEWIKNARNETMAEAQSCVEAEKMLGALKQDQARLSEKLKEALQARDSAEASLKTAEKQVEDQRQKLYVTEVNLATKKQLVKDLRAELQKAKEAAQLAKEKLRLRSKHYTAWFRRDSSEARRGALCSVQGLLRCVLG